MKFTAYDTTTGLVAFTGECQQGMLAAQGGPGLAVVEGHFDRDEWYWSGTAMERVPSEKPSRFHRFDRARQTWVGDIAAAGSFVRARRATALAATDWTQLPDVPEATRVLWQPYRQALRDVPAQAGFPFNVEWPTPPA